MGLIFLTLGKSKRHFNPDALVFRNESFEKVQELSKDVYILAYLKYSLKQAPAVCYFNCLAVKQVLVIEYFDLLQKGFLLEKAQFFTNQQ